MADSPLIQNIISTRSLLSHFLTSLSNPSPIPLSIKANAPSTQTSSSSSSPQPPAVLPLLRDSAKLLKAHTTRISLLILNKPFTPSAIAVVLRELHSTCLPALVSSAELCDANVYGTAMRTEIRARVRRALREAEQLVDEVEKVVEMENQDGQLSEYQEDSKGNRKRQIVYSEDEVKARQLTSTGLVWSACDSLVELADMGVVELAILKTNEQRLMLEDALAELKAWSEESPATDGNEDDGAVASQDNAAHNNNDGDDDDNDDNDDNDDADILFGKTPTLPAGPSPLREILTRSLKKLQSLIILYRAISKRRLRSFPDDAMKKTLSPSSSSPQPRPASKLDALQNHLSGIPSTADELAAAFYSLDAPLAEIVLSRICATGVQAALEVKMDWTGREDEFSEWLGKWIDVVTG